MLPSAAAFVDPLLSTGIPLTLLGIERLARLLEDGLPDADALARYGAATLEDADWTAQYLAGLYGAMPDFHRFSELTMFYFAAASYAEMARRLGRADLAGRFLAGHDPAFRDGLARALAATGDELPAVVSRAIAHRNVAGLCDPAKRNGYGVDLEDVVRGAQKLGTTPDAMRQILATAPWAQF
jgi:FADH2 O2-dependent halogenase